MSSVYDWSVVAATNASSDAAMTWAEGQAPSTVNNSARQLVARVAELLGDIDGSLTAGGTSSAITVTANSAFTTYANGRIIAIKASVDNAASATLNVNGLGAKSIRKFTPTEAALAGAEMKNTGIYLLMYNTALNSAAGGWHLLTPSDDLAAFVTLTGIQTLTNKTLTSPAINTPTIATPTITGGTASSFTMTGSAFNGTVGATTPSTVAGTTGTFSSTLTGANHVSTTNIFANSSAATMNLRPNGAASTTGQVTITAAGAVTVNGTLTVTG